MKITEEPKKMVIYEQKRPGYKFKFEFGDEALSYTAKDEKSDSTTEIPYAGISSKRWDFTSQNEWFRNVGYVWLGIGLFVDYTTWSAGSPHFSIWLPIGLCFLAWYYYSRTKFTVIEAEGEKILVVKNVRHDEIVKEIMTRRNDTLKKIYGAVNMENAPENELRKFEFLHKDGVITSDEFEKAKLEIEELKSRPVPSPFSL